LGSVVGGRGGVDVFAVALPEGIGFGGVSD